ncbi:MAG: ATP-binding protein [Acidobacteriota bacterium]|nr:ATP-binding protein [Acidobacteriota bacterium]
MNGKNLATVEAKDFIGRDAELDALRRHADGAAHPNKFLLLSAPNEGASELLKQIYDEFFHRLDASIPIYFAALPTDESAHGCAARLIKVFSMQTAAFRRLRSANDVTGDGESPEHSPENHQDDQETSDNRVSLGEFFNAASQTAAERGEKLSVMIDDLHLTARLTDGVDFIEELKNLGEQANLRLVFAGRRRFLYGAARTGDGDLNGAEILRLAPLNFTDAGLLTENLVRGTAIKINDRTRDLIVRKFVGNPAFIRLFAHSAINQKTDLENFQQVERLYADELFGGVFGGFYDQVFRQIAPNIETRKNLIGLIYHNLTVEKQKVSLEAWRLKLGLSEADFTGAMSLLNASEIIRVTSNLVEAMPENEVLSDYLTARFRLENAAENRALVVGETLARLLKRAPQTMAKFYRQNSALGLRELLTVFNCQPTPKSLLDDAVFKESYEGRPDAEILEELNADAEMVRLPQIIYAAHTAAFYPPIESLTEKTRSAVAFGFSEAAYTDADEIVWLAAEIDSKFEASKEAAAFWCDRLELVALVCNFKSYQIWLVAPEGFTTEAAEVLRERRAFSSSKKQVELLRKFLAADSPDSGKTPPPDEYQIVMPMGDDTELIAAHAVEEIAKRHRFSPQAVNQIKTALVEACINATEHSLSPDGRIYQKFAFAHDRLIITVANRGLRFNGKSATEFTPDEGRRGWGLKLMKSLMDEVKFEQVDDGTRITMIKHLK